MPTLNWIGKDAVVKHHHEVPFHLLKDVPELRSSEAGVRKAISDVRCFLKSQAIPLSDAPFQEFKDGWGIKPTVKDQIGRRQVKTIEDEEYADESHGDSLFTSNHDIFSFEKAGFSMSRN